MGTLLVVGLKASVLLAAGWAAAAVARRSSAATRHALWTIILAAVLVLPLLTATLPALRLTVATTRFPTAAVTADSTAPVPPHPGPSSAAGVPRHIAAASSAVAGSPQRGTLAGLLFALWTGGVLVLLARAALGHATLARIARKAVPVGGGETRAELELCKAALGLQRAVRLARSDEIDVPLTWRALSPCVLLPASESEWSPKERRAVLLHELAHVQRRDALARRLSQLVAALYWWNPLAWLAARRLRLESERACDDRALLCGSSPLDYADTLLTLAGSSAPQPVGALAMACRSDLEQRLASVLEGARRRGPSSPGRVAAAAAFAGALLVPLAAARAVPAPVVAPVQVQAPAEALPPAAPVSAVAATPAPAMAAPTRATARHAAVQESHTIARSTTQSTAPALETLAPATGGVVKEASEQPVNAAAIPALVEALKDRRWQLRTQSALALGKAGVAAVPGLESGLDDSVWQVRGAVAEALGQLGAPAVPALRKALNDGVWQVRGDAALALGEIGPPAIPALEEALQDSEWRVRSDAVKALERLGAVAEKSQWHWR